MAIWQTAGKVRMTPKGVYNSSTAYEILDIVSNADQTTSYIAKQAVPAGTALTNTTYWTVIADVTEALENAGAAISYIGDSYSSSSTYAVGDYVIHDGGLYRCKTAISTAEDWTAAHWQEVSVTDELQRVEGDVTELKSALGEKAPVYLLNRANMLLTVTDVIRGYYYWTSPVKSDDYWYCYIPVTNGETYKLSGARFISKQGTGIINDSSLGVHEYTADFDGSLIFSSSYSITRPVYFCKASDYNTYIGSLYAPTFNPNSLAQVDGGSTYIPASQLLVHNVASDLKNKIDSETVKKEEEDGVLSPLAIHGITYAEGSSIILPPWTIGKYAYNTVGDKIAFNNNINTSYIKLNVSEGRIFFNKKTRFLCVCDADNYVLVSKNNDDVLYVDIPEGSVSLYITLLNDQTADFMCGINLDPIRIPQLIASYDTAFPAYEDALDSIMLRDANKFSKTRYRESACKVGAIWYTTDQYASYDTYWFEAKANTQYTLGCATRFLTVDDTLLYKYGTIAGFVYTPESDCIVWACIAKNESNPIKCVAAPTTLDDVNPAGSMTPNPSYVAQSTGNSPAMLMSQKAITEALNQIGLSDSKKLYGKGFATIKGKLADGDSLSVPLTNVKKNNVYSFVCKVTSFSSILIGHGKTVYDSNYFEITGTKIILHTYYTSDNTREWAHGITISDYLYVQIHVGNGTAKFQMYSNGQSFSQDEIAWAGDGNAKSFVESVGSTLTDCEFTWSSSDFRKSVWAFGDSYFGFTGSSRWPYYLAQNSYLDNVLLNAYPGENTTGAITALNNMITNFGCPNFIVWCLGMNDGTDADINTPSSGWMNGVNTVLSLCTTYGITPIFATIPSVPGRTGVNPICHEGKNKWIRESVYRYIDFAKAVGATWDGADTTWYTGMISSDGVHPDTLGALALYYRAIADVPEFTYTNP